MQGFKLGLGRTVSEYYYIMYTATLAVVIMNYYKE